MIWLPTAFIYYSFLLETVTFVSGKYSCNSYQTVLDWNLLFGNGRLSGLSYNPNHWILMMVKPWQEMEVGVAGQGLFHTWRRVPVSKVHVRHVHALTDIPTRMKSMINLPLFSAGDGFNHCLLYIIHFSLHYTFYGCFSFETMCSQAVYPWFSA